MDNLFLPASAIVEGILSWVSWGFCCFAYFTETEHLAKEVTDRAKRPQDPIDLDITIDESSIPGGFLRAEVESRDRRHLIFATYEQLDKLSKAKLCRPPVTQLFIANAFVLIDSDSTLSPSAS